MGYTDDTAETFVVRKVEDGQRSFYTIIRRESSCLEVYGLDLAVEKTKIVFLARRRMSPIIQVKVGAEDFITKKAVKYLEKTR